MGGACTKGDTLSPTSKAQEFVQNIRADSTVPVISNDDQADDHIERALFPLHPSVQLHDSIPELPRTCATVTSNARTVLIELYVVRLVMMRMGAHHCKWGTITPTVPSPQTSCAGSHRKDAPTAPMQMH